MVPGQSAEDLGQQCQKMGAGEDEEGGRGSRRLRQLPAAAGKVVGCWVLPNSSVQLVWMWENLAAQPTDCGHTHCLGFPQSERANRGTTALVLHQGRCDTFPSRPTFCAWVVCGVNPFLHADHPPEQRTRRTWDKSSAPTLACSIQP